MPPLAYTALTAAIVLSALGAVVLCGLTVMYGFTPELEESPGRAARRTLLTRVGHAVAAACFAATAILLAVVLGQPVRPAPTPAGEVRAPALDAKLDAQMQRLHGVEQRMKDSEQTLERLEMEISEVTARHMGAESESPAKTEEKAAPAAKPAPRPRTSSVKPAAAPKAVTPSSPAERAVTETAAVERPATSRPLAAPTEHAFTPKPLDDPAASPGPSSGTAPAAPVPPPAPAMTPPVTQAPSGSASVARSPATPRPSEPAPANDLRSKFRNDWQSIQRGWDRAADDFKRAIGPLRGNE